jgi:hypothetical protein
MLLFCCCFAAYRWYQDKIVAEERAKKISWMLKNSSGNASIVEEGDIVLIKKGNSYAGLIIKKQSGSSEQMQFDWFYRTDGSGKIFANDAAVQRGSGIAKEPTSRSNIHFGPFDLQWSGGDLDLGIGWFYYSEDNSFELCILRHADRQSLDASSEQYKYKAKSDLYQEDKPFFYDAPQEK